MYLHCLSIWVPHSTASPCSHICVQCLQKLSSVLLCVSSPVSWAVFAPICLRATQGCMYQILSSLLNCKKHFTNFLQLSIASVSLGHKHPLLHIHESYKDAKHLKGSFHFQSSIWSVFLRHKHPLLQPPQRADKPVLLFEDSQGDIIYSNAILVIFKHLHIHESYKDAKHLEGSFHFHSRIWHSQIGQVLYEDNKNKAAYHEGRTYY